MPMTITLLCQKIVRYIIKTTTGKEKQVKRSLKAGSFYTIYTDFTKRHGSTQAKLVIFQNILVVPAIQVVI